MPPKKAEKLKCAKCGFMNLPSATFCSGCGTKLEVSQVEGKGTFGAQLMLLLVGSAYLFISLATSALFQIWYFAVPSFISALLGVYVCFRLYKEQLSVGVAVCSAIAIGVGFAVTLMVFLIGFAIKGVIGPSWVIFLAAGFSLWRDRRSVARVS